VTVAPDGTLFFGTTSGALVQMKDGEFTRLEHRNGTGVTSVILAAHDGILWFSLLGRPIYRWAGQGKAKSVGRYLDNMGTVAMAEDAHGAVWIGTNRDGLVRVEGGKFTQFPVTRDAIQALRFDRSGSLWIGTPHGLLRMRNGQVERFTTAHGLSHDSVSAILEDRDSNLWIGTTGGGLSRLSKGRWSRFTTKDGLSDDEVRTLVEDHEGNLWVGTADGLNSLSDARFASFGRPEGLYDHSVASVVPARDGGVWIGTNSGAITRLRRDGAVQHYDLPAGLGRERVVALHEARDGAVWIGVDNGRLFRLANERITDLTPTGVSSAWKANLISEDEEGVLLFIASVGFARVRDGKVVTASPKVKELGYMHSMHRDKKGALWMTGSDGIYRLEGGDLKRWGSKEGLRRNRVRGLTEEPDGSFWLANAGGLVHFRPEDGKMRTLGTEHGLPENYLRCVLDDGLGYLWIASMGSVFRIDKQEAYDVLDGKKPRLTPVMFDTFDGLRTTEATLSNHPGFRAADGQLWFATARGVSVVDPTRISVNEPAPDVRIERVEADGRADDSPTAGTAIAYAPGRGQVTVEYAALSFRAVGRVHFRHRLEGFDEGWVEAGARRSAYYSNLPPGHYRFRVTACNHDGVWNGREAGFAFVIQPPFYRTGWFYAASAAALLLLAAVAYRLRMNQMRVRFAAIIGERTRIARELHDTLAQGLAGTGIQLDTALTVLPEEPEAAREYVRLGRAMVRSTLAEVRRSIWVLRAQTSKGAEGLSRALPDSLRQLTDQVGLEPRISVLGEPRELPAEVERNLLRIAHEAVTNAVRHASATTLSVELDFARDGVHLRVRDDGRGFDPEPWLVKRRGDHFGLVGMAERVRGLGGDLHVRSREGEGTQVGCRLPYECRMGTPEAEGREGAPS
jgi:signal transduction histidine kinase/streptogramin lyase